MVPILAGRTIPMKGVLTAGAKAALTIGSLFLTIPPLTRSGGQRRSVDRRPGPSGMRNARRGTRAEGHMSWRKWFVRGLVFSIMGGMGCAALLYQRWTDPAAVRQHVI